MVCPHSHFCFRFFSGLPGIPSAVYLDLMMVILKPFLQTTSAVQMTTDVQPQDPTEVVPWNEDDREMHSQPLTQIKTDRLVGSYSWETWGGKMWLCWWVCVPVVCNTVITMPAKKILPVLRCYRDLSTIVLW